MPSSFLMSLAQCWMCSLWSHQDRSRKEQERWSLEGVYYWLHSVAGFFPLWLHYIFELESLSPEGVSQYTEGLPRWVVYHLESSWLLFCVFACLLSIVKTALSQGLVSLQNQQWYDLHGSQKPKSGLWNYTCEMLSSSQNKLPSILIRVAETTYSA